jgi:cytochrome P450
MFYPAGAETTFRTLGSMMYRVLSEPEMHERLLARPDDRSAAVEEILRQDGGVASLPRYTEKPITVGGVDIPAHSRLLFGIASANRDAEVFEDPEALSFENKRAAPSLGRRGQHLAFGHGVHFCLGSHLAREELRVTLSLLLDRLPGLRLAEMVDVGITGTMLRGVHRLPVLFDDVLPAPAA